MIQKKLLNRFKPRAFFERRSISLRKKENNYYHEEFFAEEVVSLREKDFPSKRGRIHLSSGNTPHSNLASDRRRIQQEVHPLKFQHADSPYEERKGKISDACAGETVRRKIENWK
jgi:hypothetical protein